MHGPSPFLRHPIVNAERTGFLDNLITKPGIEVGDCTHYDDPPHWTVRGPPR